MKRILELDSIRGLAAFAIMLNHLPFSSWAFRAGAYGVDLFFVLSGYLITTIILKRGNTPGFMGSFYARRSLRIWPIYYLVFFFVILVNPLLSHPFRMDGWPFVATYTQGIQNYWFGTVPPFSPLMDHTWTLALEEQYYLIWPVLVLFTNRLSLVAIGCILLSIVARSMGFSHRLLIGRSDGFAMGGLLALIFLEMESGRRTRRHSLLIFASAIVVVIGVPWIIPRFLNALAITPDERFAALSSLRLAAVSLGFSALLGILLLCSGQRWLKPLRDPRLCYLGLISYGLYLYHYPIYYCVDAVFSHPQRWWSIGLKISTTLAIASFSWNYIERPILKWKERFEYRGPSDKIGPV